MTLSSLWRLQTDTRMMRAAMHRVPLAFRRALHLSPSVARSTQLPPPAITADTELKPEYDAVIIGGGHNGLVCAAYLQRAGLSTCVLERRHVVGGAAVTEEIVPGFKFSRASYVLSLLRPQIVTDLELKRHGLKLYLRDPSSYTPIRPEFQPASGATSLTLSSDHQFNKQQIACFSSKDAERYGEYEAQMGRLVEALDPLLDVQPPDFSGWKQRSLRSKLAQLRQLRPLLRAGRAMGTDLLSFYELMTAPGAKVLNQWFESEPLKATLVTDALVGAMVGPSTPGSGYNLLHHVAGESDGVKGAWAYPEGGMGAVSAAICRSALEKGAHVFTDKAVSKITTAGGAATGVVLADGRQVRCSRVFSNLTPDVTFLKLLEKQDLPQDYRTAVSNITYTSISCKINVALSRLPNFLADPNNSSDEPMPHHRCTIHLNSETTECLEEAYRDAAAGRVSNRPLIEMTIPSSLDPTLAPPGQHVALLFTQYCPYSPADGPWDDAKREAYATRVFDCIEEYAPGFKDSVVGKEVLTPPDIEQIFGLTGGNIFHGALSLDQLFLARPTPQLPGPATPVRGLFLCGSGSHPGGGVMGAPGRLAALAAAAKG